MYDEIPKFPSWLSFSIVFLITSSFWPHLLDHITFLVTSFGTDLRIKRPILRLSELTF